MQVLLLLMLVLALELMRHTRVYGSSPHFFIRPNQKI